MQKIHIAEKGLTACGRRLQKPYICTPKSFAHFPAEQQCKQCKKIVANLPKEVHPTNLTELAAFLPAPTTLQPLED